jgi:uncharacterized membrane protein
MKRFYSRQCSLLCVSRLAVVEQWVVLFPVLAESVVYVLDVARYYSRCHRILEQLLSFLSVVGLVQGCRHAAHRQSGWSLGICGLLSNRGSGSTIVLERHNL